jgi:hypothetical protein
MRSGSFSHAEDAGHLATVVCKRDADHAKVIPMLRAGVRARPGTSSAFLCGHTWHEEGASPDQWKKSLENRNALESSLISV